MSAAPTLGTPALAASRADEAITADRVEEKYLVPADRVARLLRDLATELPSHRFVGEGANRLPGAHHFVTTIYFDTDSRAHYRATIENGSHNVKIRAKEYYDVHPSLAEVATHPAQIARYQPWVWFELKRRDGARTLKQRFRLPKKQVPDFFLHGRLVPDALTAADGEETSAAAESVLGYCRSLGEPLAASSVVNYRRLPFQDATGELRVTVDVGLAFFAPPAELWTSERALVRSALGTPKGVSNEAVLEIKRRGPQPEWVRAMLARAGVTEVGFSKFAAATEAVYGDARPR